MATKLPDPSDLIKPYRFSGAENFDLSAFDPTDTQKLDLRHEAGDLLRQRIGHLSRLQQKLYADGNWGVLLIFQSMDAGGKDSVIRHVVSGVNPEGYRVYSLKTPSPEELRHDYLWRTSKLVPERGQLALFSRSYYEEVLVVRVNPAMLEKQRIPKVLTTPNIWRDRLQDIRAFEKYLCRNGFPIRKFFLNVSREEQRKRFLRRVTQEDKHWKFSEDDLRDREKWADFRAAYEEAIRQTATPEAPWYIVPADHKWFTRLVVVSAMIDTLESLHLTYPQIDEVKRKKMEAARKQLMKEG